MELLVLDSNIWKHVNASKQIISDLFKNNITCKLYIYIYIGFGIKLPTSVDMLYGMQSTNWSDIIGLISSMSQISFSQIAIFGTI